MTHPPVPAPVPALAPAPASNHPLIEVEGLKVRRGGRMVLDLPAFSVGAGEVLAVIGPNGAGKSTLLQALAMLLPAEMNYRFAGLPLRLPREAPALRRHMAVVFQDPLLLDTSVFENVALGLRLRRVPKDEVREQVAAWLAKLGVNHLARRHARDLSGGEARRVSLARALVLRPSVLFLDEPFGSLDVPTRMELLGDLRNLLRDTGVTTLLVTHEFTEVLPLADRVAVLVRGRLAQVGTPREVFNRPADDLVRSLVRGTVDLVNAVKGLDD
ncbi:MAG: ABC transporter ATP-binding protein [Firmicutes bacterium]|nr:ABC transporter ATP-binding protein [Bacillota bacterium]